MFEKEGEGERYALSVVMPCFVPVHALWEGAHAHGLDIADDTPVLEEERRGLGDEVFDVCLGF